MMGSKERNFQPLPEDFSLEDLVPEDNFYRRLQQKLDLSFERELVEDRYAASGRPSVDPEVFFRLQLVMFYEGIRSERELMRIASERLSVRWYVGYDLHEPLPDHSSLTRIRDRFGLPVFREFFERIVELCVEAGLVWGEELYFDATKVDASASLDSIAPRFYVKEHLGEVFTVEEPPNAEQEDNVRTASERGESPVAKLYELPFVGDDALAEENATKDDWISRDGRQRRERKGVWYRRKADFLASSTDPDSSPMKRRDSKGSHLGHYTHYVVDGGKARIILNALVTPFEVTENAPIPRQVTGDTAYATTENIAAMERAGIRAYVPLTGAGKARPYFSKEEFAYDPEQDLYQCPAGDILRPKTFRAARNQVLYKTERGTCDSCSMRLQCTDNKTGRQVLRHRDERYVDRVKSYRGTFAYEKALRKRRVWVEPLFGEAKDWHGLCRFRLRRLEKVNIEALLIASGQNVKRLVAARDRAPRKLAQAAALRPPDPVSCCRSHVTGRWPSLAEEKAYFNSLASLDAFCDLVDGGDPMPQALGPRFAAVAFGRTNNPRPIALQPAPSAPFLKDGIHRSVAEPPNGKGEGPCRSCYAPAYSTMPRKSRRSANWLEAAMLLATGWQEPASSSSVGKVYAPPRSLRNLVVIRRPLGGASTASIPKG
jgi:transposase